MPQTFNQLRIQSGIVDACLSFTRVVASTNMSINDLHTTKFALKQAATSNNEQQKIKQLYMDLIDVLIKFKQSA